MAENHDDDYQFETGDAGASHTFPMEAGQIRKGGFMVIKDRPCKVMDVSTSKTGKHGHAKCNFVAIDIFTGKKLEDMVPSTHNTSVPIVVRKEFTLLDVSEDGFAVMMDENSNTKEDLKIPDDEVGAKIKEDLAAGRSLSVTVLAAMGEEKIIASKEDK
eukprot:TRINITY_DN2565_c0_g1::TRINITY_DN2565_c0_g1_i1::g.19304::m.19304 TRINITY_DN2565_c0_g1::TRINITY_DN2565_c0_g1_i1::g.19304  ORF type:complete len:159 (+),score=74.41,sp/P24922/IF5A2_NICPL/61.44/2e-62,eIF-5a/PF01287.15/1.2e-23,EFP_N/PF08207.7/0.043 TRINITY_DN2565_c0_g1_i1:52-528(+)